MSKQKPTQPRFSRDVCWDISQEQVYLFFFCKLDIRTPDASGNSKGFLFSLAAVKIITLFTRVTIFDDIFIVFFRATGGICLFLYIILQFPVVKVGDLASVVLFWLVTNSAFFFHDRNSKF